MNENDGVWLKILAFFNNKIASLLLLLFIIIIIPHCRADIEFYQIHFGNYGFHGSRPL